MSQYALVLFRVMRQKVFAASAVGWTWMMDSIRAAAREFLFPSNPALAAGNPALPDPGFPDHIGEF